MKLNKKLKIKWPWKVAWTERTKQAAKFIPADTSVIDLGGGLGEFYKYLKGKSYYLALDQKEWTEFTVKCDFNKDELPAYPPFQFIVCLGTLEYIENPEKFLNDIRKYSDKLVITYRENSNGGMDRKSNLNYEELEKLLEKNGWEILTKKRVNKGDRLYYCNKIEINETN